MSEVDRMEALARKYHEGQFRDDGKTPYIVHPAAVVARLRRWGVDEANGEDDVVSLAVAWGHDLLEDTAVREEEILAVGALGPRILEGVRLLTFKPSAETGKGRERDQLKAAYVMGVAKNAPAVFLCVKIADRLCNTEDFLAGEGRRKALCYLQKGAELLANSSRQRMEVSSACGEDCARVVAKLIGDCGDYPELMADLLARGKSEAAAKEEVASRIRQLTWTSMIQSCAMGRWDVHMGIELHRIDILRTALENGADLDYRGYDGECIVHDLMESAFAWDGSHGDVAFAREALRLIVEAGLGDLLEYVDDEGYSPGYLFRRNRTAVALLAEFGVGRDDTRKMPAPWKDEAYEQFMRAEQRSDEKDRE